MSDYDDFLDENYPVKIGDISYNASDVLKEIDPIGYGEGKLNYEDMQNEE